MSQNRKLRRAAMKDKHFKKIKDAQAIATELLSVAVSKREEDITDGITGSVLALTMWALHNDFGFGKERLTKYICSVFDFSRTLIVEKIPIDEAFEVLEAACKAPLQEIIDEKQKDANKTFKKRRDFLETYRFHHRIRKSSECEPVT